MVGNSAFYRQDSDNYSAINRKKIQLDNRQLDTMLCLNYSVQQIY